MINYDYLNEAAARYTERLRVAERIRAHPVPARPAWLLVAAVRGMDWLGQHLLAWACELQHRLAPTTWGDAVRLPCGSGQLA